MRHHRDATATMWVGMTRQWQWRLHPIARHGGRRGPPPVSVHTAACAELQSQKTFGTCGTRLPSLRSSCSSSSSPHISSLVATSSKMIVMATVGEVVDSVWIAASMCSRERKAFSLFLSLYNFSFLFGESLRTQRRFSHNYSNYPSTGWICYAKILH